MPIVYVTASTPGSLYIDAKPIAAIEEEPIRLSVGQEGAHLLFAPYRDGLLPIARHLSGNQTLFPAQWQGLDAVLWPGGTAEIRLSPLPAARHTPIASAEFGSGEAHLYAAGGIHLELPGGQSFPIGEGIEGGLHRTPLGHLAAFATRPGKESLRLLAPMQGGEARTLLHIQAEQILLSAEGTKVRSTQTPLPGHRVGIIREYAYQPGSGAFLQTDIRAGEDEALTEQTLPFAMVMAVLAGRMETALSYLSPSLRGVVQSSSLAAFLGPFDGCVQARHAPTMAGVHTLALLRPEGDAHVARVLAFALIQTENGPLIDNIRAWEENK